MTEILKFIDELPPVVDGLVVALGLSSLLFTLLMKGVPMEECTCEPNNTFIYVKQGAHFKILCGQCKLHYATFTKQQFDKFKLGKEVVPLFKHPF